MGIFAGFIDDASVELVGVEEAGDGLDTDRHSASLSRGTPGVLHGSLSYLLQDAAGQVHPAHSISAGLDYPGVGPEHAQLAESGRAEYVRVSDDEALSSFHRLCRCEGIIPALESAHALYAAEALARELGPEADVLVCRSGRGDKDIDTVIGRSGR
jgi:tryptophan synthase beta chain